jgi:DNA-binding XRE family transcriptional regulator
MQTFFVAETVSRDGPLFVAEARDKKGRFLGVVSEATRAESLAALKALVLEMLLEFADQGENPLLCLYRTVPRQGGLDLRFQELFPVVLRYKRCRRGLTQSAMAARLAVAQQVYARLERPGKANPTLSTVQRLSTILHEDILALT